LRSNRSGIESKQFATGPDDGVAYLFGAVDVEPS